MPMRSKLDALLLAAVVGWTVRDCARIRPNSAVERRERSHQQYPERSGASPTLFEYSCTTIGAHRRHAPHSQMAHPGTAGAPDDRHRRRTHGPLPRSLSSAARRTALCQVDVTTTDLGEAGDGL